MLSKYFDNTKKKELIGNYVNAGQQWRPAKQPRTVQGHDFPTPDVIARIEALMKHDVAGDPCTGIKWTRRATRKIAQELRALAIVVCPRTVARLLRDLDFSLQVNRKQLSRGSGPDRNEQFEYIAAQRTHFAARGLPVVSIDSNYDPSRIMDAASGAACTPGSAEGPAAVHLIRDSYT